MEFKGYDFNKTFSRLNMKKKGKMCYLEKWICLDTETSHNHKENDLKCWVYQWSFTFNGGLYFGRTPDELCERLNEISKFYTLDNSNRVKIFVHNLPYDFSYLSLFFQKHFGEPTHVLAYASHKVFNISYDNGLEFNCSYKLSNDSLARWSSKLNTPHKKLVGAIDYDMIRTQTTKLCRDDWRYMFYDVIVLDECIQKQIELYNDTIATMPLTSTGYVRREILRSFNGKGKHRYINNNRYQFTETRLNVETYTACQREFSGGISQGNRLLKGETINGNIKHRDFRSHYPSQQRTRKFPMSRFVKLTNETTIDYLLKYRKDYAVIVSIYLQDVRLKSKKITLPYLQLSHVLRERSVGLNYIDDNGRVLCFKGVCHMYLDLNELLLIAQQYQFKYKIDVSYCSKLDYLPHFMTDIIDEHYKAKSDLKAKVKELEKAGASRDDILTASLDLMKSKNFLNGIYGCTCTALCRTEYLLHGNVWECVSPSTETMGEQLDKYYKSYKNCMRYQWGYYTALWGRLELMKFVQLIGYDKFIYADTDSIFYLSDDETEKRIEEENKKMYNNAIDHGAYITTDNGEIIVYDQFEIEPENIVKMRFLHSKCYAFVTDDNELHSTIAGVCRKAGKTFEEDELQDIENLKDGFTFVKCGGTKAKYICYDIQETDGGTSCGGCVITPTTKTLNEREMIEREDIYVNDSY